MFAQSQRFETGYCTNCNKKMLLIRRGLGYEWRCKECGTVCKTEHKIEAEKALKEGCTIKSCFIVSLLITFWLGITGHFTQSPIIEIIGLFIALSFSLWIIARILVSLQK